MQSHNVDLGYKSSWVWKFRMLRNKQYKEKGAFYINAKLIYLNTPTHLRLVVIFWNIIK